VRRGIRLSTRAERHAGVHVAWHRLADGSGQHRQARPKEAPKDVRAESEEEASALHNEETPHEKSF
jgi:hypothetical protein